MSVALDVVAYWGERIMKIIPILLRWLLLLWGWVRAIMTMRLEAVHSNSCLKYACLLLHRPLEKKPRGAVVVVAVVINFK
jgi:hypothetical protein